MKTCRVQSISLIAVLIYVMAAMSLEARGSSGSDQPQIGALIRNTDEQFVKDYADNLGKLAKENGIRLKLLGARGDAAMQMDQLSTLLVQGIKYFVIVPTDTNATADMASAIQANGGAAAFSNIQPSVAALKTGKKFFLASSPEKIAGQIQGEILDTYFKSHPKKLENGDAKKLDLILVLGQLGHPAQVNRTSSVLATLKSKGYDLNIIAKDTANWKPSEAQQKMDVWLTTYRNQFDAVIANNDGMALGVIESMLTQGYIDDPSNPEVDTDGDGTVVKVPVIGVDATQIALQSMAENKLYATVLQDAEGQSATAFDLIKQVALDQFKIGNAANGINPLNVPIEEEPCNDITVSEQCYLVPFKPVTKENYKDFIK